MQPANQLSLLSLPQLGKSVVARVRIPSGSVLTLEQLVVKVAEPPGVPAEDIFQLVGRRVAQEVDQDQSLTPELLIGPEMTP